MIMELYNKVCECGCRAEDHILGIDGYSATGRPIVSICANNCKCYRFRPIQVIK